MGCCQAGTIYYPDKTLPTDAKRLQHLDTTRSKFYMDSRERFWKIHTEPSSIEIGQMFQNNCFIVGMKTHPHILKPLQVSSVSALSISITMPLASEDLFCIMSKPFDCEWISDQLMGIVDAIHTLHQSGRAHRDIKPENIVNHKGKLKLIDFDFCYTLSVLAHCGTPYFKCPIAMTERWLLPVEEKSKKMDVYGLGKLIMSILWQAPGHNVIQNRIFAFETFHKSFVTSDKHLYTGVWGQWCSIALICLRSEPPSRVPIHLMTTSEVQTTSAAEDTRADMTGLEMGDTNPVFT